MFTRMPAYMYSPLLFAISEKGIKGQSVDGGVKKKGVCMSEREKKKVQKRKEKRWEGEDGKKEKNNMKASSSGVEFLLQAFL